MEILVPGLILVALMVYASTRIKKSAAMAYEAEAIETDEFIIQKPDGFLNVIGGDAKFAFEAYSKGFGAEGADEIRQGTAHLTVIDGSSADEVAKETLSSGKAVVSDVSVVVDGIHYRTIEMTSGANASALRSFFKIAEHRGKVFKLDITVLNETTDEFMRNIESILGSFALK